VTGFGVNVEDLTNHAARLTALAEEMGVAVDAIDAAYVGDDAYGKLGSSLATALNAVQDAGRRAVTNAMEGLVLAAADVEDAAAEYADTDQDNVQRIEDSGTAGGD
jgi:hypothetical protein